MGKINILNDSGDAKATLEFNGSSDLNIDTETLDGFTGNVQGQIDNKVDKVSSTDNAVARFNGTTGEVQNSSVTIDDSGNVGIGTSSSTIAKVQVSGTTNIPTHDSYAQTHSILLQDTANKPSLSLFSNSANSVIYATSAEQYRSSLIHRYNADSGSDCFKVEQLRPSNGDTLERLKIDSAGRVTMPYQPSFHAVKSAHVTGSGNITFNVVNHNTGNHYNPNDGTFTAPVTGVYFFSFSTLLYSMNTSTNVSLFKNGYQANAMSSFGTYGQFTGTYAGQGASAVIKLNANDYVTMYVRHSGTNLHSGYTWWSGHLVG